MNEAMRHEIVQRRQAGASMRAIAEELGISRGAVGRVLAQVQAQRDGRPRRCPGRAARGSILDPYEPILQELLAKYPNLTAERALQELQARGFTRQVHGRARARAAACGRARAGARAALRDRARRCRHRWTTASTTSTSRAKAGGASTCSATCSATRGGSTCASSSRWTCRPRCASTCTPSITWAASPASACTTTSRWWCLRHDADGPLLQPEVPRLRHALRLPAAGLPRAPAANQRESRAASSTTSKPACSTAAPSTRWSISTR